MRKEISIYKYYSGLFFSAIILSMSSCNSEVDKKKGKELLLPVEDTVVFKKEIKEPEYVMTYHLDSLVNEVQIDSFETNYSTEEQKVLFALNRLDPSRLKVGSKLLIPDSLMLDFNQYSSFPKEFMELDSIPKTVLINQRTQGFALYENGKLVKWGPVSSGKASTPTPNGLHYGNYKAKRKVSTVNEDWLLPYYFNFMNFEGVGVHQYLLPGFPASHACVRLRMNDAQFIYEWAKQWELNKSGGTVEKNGTPFMVFGEYDYADPFPWQELALDGESNNLTPDEIEIIRKYVEQYKQDERNFKNINQSEDLLALK